MSLLSIIYLLISMTLASFGLVQLDGPRAAPPAQAVVLSLAICEGVCV